MDNEILSNPSKSVNTRRRRAFCLLLYDVCTFTVDVFYDVNFINDKVSSNDQMYKLR